FGDVAVTRGGSRLGVLSPAKFAYKKMPDSMTTEVAMSHSLRDDLYLVVGSINPQTKVASFQIHINPLVSWIWFGAIVLIFGSIICMWPELAPAESRVWAFGRGAAGAVASFTIGVFIAMLPAPAWAQMGTSAHDNLLHIENDHERQLFSHLRCMCGGCARDLLSTCTCDFAEDTREAMRKKIQAGETDDQIIMEYGQKWGSDALAIPPNKGGMRAIYAVPLVAFAAGGAGVVVLMRRWSSRSGNSPTPKARSGSEKGKRDDYDDRLDEELRDLDG